MLLYSNFASKLKVLKESHHGGGGVSKTDSKSNIESQKIFFLLLGSHAYVLLTLIGIFSTINLKKSMKIIKIQLTKGRHQKKQTAKVRTLSQPPRPPPCRGSDALVGEFFWWIFLLIFWMNWVIMSTIHFSPSNDFFLPVMTFFLPAIPFSPTKEVGTSAICPQYVIQKNNISVKQAHFCKIGFSSIIFETPCVPLSRFEKNHFWAIFIFLLFWSDNLGISRDLSHCENARQ